MIDFKLLKKYSSNVSVLLIDDDLEVIDSTKKILDTLFACVDTAINGKEGIDVYNKFYNENNKFYDIVISDLDMPKLDGISLINLIYKINNKQKIIVLSAHNSQDNLLYLLNIKIDQFIVKPMDSNIFLGALFKIVETIYNDNDNDLISINSLLTWDNKRKILYKNHDEIKLTKKEWLLVDLLINSKVKIEPQEHIINLLWNDSSNYTPDIGNLKNIISRMRNKIPELEIENIYGRGYKIK